MRRLHGEEIKKNTKAKISEPQKCKHHAFVEKDDGFWGFVSQ